MTKRRVGLWFIGAWGGVASTAALGLSALSRKLAANTALVTAGPLFDGIDLDEPAQFVVGGADLRRTSYWQAIQELHDRSNLFDAALIECCKSDLDAWDTNVRPGTVQGAGSTIARLAELPEAQRLDTPKQIIERIQNDLREFKTRHNLDQVVGLNVASTEPPFDPDERFQTVVDFRAILEKKATDIPASALYAWAVLDLGWPFVNFTPSLGASFPAALDLAQEKKAITCGKDGKTGETLMKSVLAPMFAMRNLKILSWVG